MADGLMSQAIANVTQASSQLTAITGLPDAASAVQTSIAQTLTTTIPPVRSAAAAVLDFAAQAAQPLGAVNVAITTGDAAAAKAALEKFQSVMQPATSAVGAAVSGVTSALTALAADSQALADIGSGLQAQVNDATAQAAAASAQADSLNQSKLYWLALGPLGLVGLAICVAEITQANDKVNGLRQQVSQLQAQSAQWTQMQANVGVLRTDIPNLSDTLLSLQNALTFLGGDITEVISDVGNAQTGSAIARAFVLTAQQQLSTLRTDAS